jgi:hypothetical protein
MLGERHRKGEASSIKASHTREIEDPGRRPEERKMLSDWSDSDDWWNDSQSRKGGHQPPTKAAANRQRWAEEREREAERYVSRKHPRDILRRQMHMGALIKRSSRQTGKGKNKPLRNARNTGLKKKWLQPQRKLGFGGERTRPAGFTGEGPAKKPVPERRPKIELQETRIPEPLARKARKADSRMTRSPVVRACDGEWGKNSAIQSCASAPHFHKQLPSTGSLKRVQDKKEETLGKPTEWLKCQGDLSCGCSGIHGEIDGKKVETSSHGHDFIKLKRMLPQTTTVLGLDNQSGKATLKEKENIMPSEHKASDGVEWDADEEKEMEESPLTVAQDAAGWPAAEEVERILAVELPDPQEIPESFLIPVRPPDSPKPAHHPQPPAIQSEAEIVAGIRTEEVQILSFTNEDNGWLDRIRSGLFEAVTTGEVSRTAAPGSTVYSNAIREYRLFGLHIASRNANLKSNVLEGCVDSGRRALIYPQIVDAAFNNRVTTIPPYNPDFTRSSGLRASLLHFVKDLAKDPIGCTLSKGELEAVSSTSWRDDNHLYDTIAYIVQVLTVRQLSTSRQLLKSAQRAVN